MKRFSLVELLVVLAVIGILTSILLPVLGKSRQRSKRVICKNNLKQNYLGVFLYTDDNDNRFMSPYETEGSGYLTNFYEREIAYYLNDGGESQSCPNVIDKYDKQAVPITYKGVEMSAYRSYTANDLRSSNAKSETYSSGISTARSRMGLFKTAGKKIKITHVNPKTIVAFEGNYHSNEYVRFWGYLNYSTARAINLGNHQDEAAHYSITSGAVLAGNSSQWQSDESIRVVDPNATSVLGGLSISFNYNNPVEFNDWSWDQ